MNKFFPIFLLCVLFFDTGCHSFRRKFIRKKKPQAETPVYVDFKDYPQKPSREAYLNYYLFVRGWLDELAEALNKGISRKRQMRAADEAIMNLEQIISFYNMEGKDAIYPIYEDVVGVRQEIERNGSLSGIKKDQLIKKIEYVKRRFEKEFNFSDAEKWMN